jgi:transcriptional regulator with XRE-family HTH domain
MNTLRRLLKEQHMTQSELAARSGVCREYITRLCTGSRPAQRHNASTMVALAWALEIPVESLSEYLEVVPLGPRSDGIVYGASADWVKQLRRGRDPFVERAS